VRRRRELRGKELTADHRDAQVDGASNLFLKDRWRERQVVECRGIRVTPAFGGEEPIRSVSAL